MSADEILRAWREPGPRPDVHAAAQARLRREWPTLARALDEAARRPTIRVEIFPASPSFAEVYRGRRSPCPRCGA